MIEQGNLLIFRSYNSRLLLACSVSDAFRYVEHRKMSVGGRAVESHCEEKQLKAERVTLLILEAHEKET